jgi:hypothetical protein
MERWIANLITMMVMIGTIGGVYLTGVWMKLRNARLVKAGSGGEDVQRLREELDALREDSSAQIAELHERLDFAERLLAQPRPDQAPLLPPPAPPRPRVITPS